MSDLPTYTLQCESAAAAELLAGLLRERGFINAESDHGVMRLRWGGGAKGLIDIYDLARDLGVASDLEWSEFLMQAARQETS